MYRSIYRVNIVTFKIKANTIEHKRGRPLWTTETASNTQKPAGSSSECVFSGSFPVPSSSPSSCCIRFQIGVPFYWQCRGRSTNCHSICHSSTNPVDPSGSSVRRLCSRTLRLSGWGNEGTLSLLIGLNANTIEHKWYLLLVAPYLILVSINSKL